MAVVSLFRGSKMAAVTLGETKNKTIFRAAVDKSYHIYICKITAFELRRISTVHQMKENI